MKFVVDAPFMLASYIFLRRRGPMAELDTPIQIAVRFRPSRSRKHRGTATLFDGGMAEVELSRTLIKDAGEGLAMMAHEMLHLAQSMAEEDGDDFHGPWFRKHGKRLCRYYGWSHEQFGLRG